MRGFLMVLVYGFLVVHIVSLMVISSIDQVLLVLIVAACPLLIYLTKGKLQHLKWFNPGIWSCLLIILALSVLPSHPLATMNPPEPVLDTASPDAQPATSEMNAMNQLSQAQKAAPPKVITRHVDVDVVKTEDLSHKVLGGSMSSYTADELNNLPIDKKMAYRVVVKSVITKDQVRPIMEAVINRMTQEDPDIDEIRIWLYSDRSLINMPYDIAMATWGPGGSFGNITPEIAVNNDRTGYDISIEMDEDFESVLKQRGKSEDKLGLSEAKRRQVYREVILDGRKAQAKADKIASTREYFELKNQLRDQSDARLRKKYGVTQQQLDAICTEGVLERWPMPE
jgi:hypothetical protein